MVRSLKLLAVLCALGIPAGIPVVLVPISSTMSRNPSNQLPIVDTEVDQAESR